MTIPNTAPRRALVLFFLCSALLISCRTPQPIALKAAEPLVIPDTPLQPACALPDPLETARRRNVLARQMERLWTRDAARIVAVLDDAQRATTDAPPLTFLLAIAYAETSGMVLDVSEAGAVGLAQATPVAYITENFCGRLFVTQDYIDGTKAYLLKKPLHDVDVIASVYVENGERSLPVVHRLLDAANHLRSEGVDELNTMEQFARPDYIASIDRATQHNVELLAELSRLVDEGDRAGLMALRDRARGEYRALFAFQKEAWRSYERDLIAERDRLLREHYNDDPSRISREYGYEAGEWLATVLDDRFSPTHMAAFLAAHLRTKQREAVQLGVSPAQLETYTAALYNGGSHNVKRMQAGLIGSLPETDNYMRKVPSTKHMLDATLAALATRTDSPPKADPSSSATAAASSPGTP